jgi:hypothetical protein
MVSAKPVSLGRREVSQALLQEFDAAAIRQQHTAEQTQQSGFAATRWTLEEHTLTAVQSETLYVQ